MIFGIFVISGILNDLISDIKKAGLNPAYLSILLDIQFEITAPKRKEVHAVMSS